jgi:hypothetical protein
MNNKHTRDSTFTISRNYIGFEYVALNEVAMIP